MFDRKDKSYDKNSLRTPEYLLRWIKAAISGYHVDLAADPFNATCESYMTKTHDALSMRWGMFGTVGFCNPPYGRKKGTRVSYIDLFVAKAVEEANRGFMTIMVIPELNGEKRSEMILTEATDIYHFDGRVNFMHPETGKECKGNNRGTIVAVFDDHKYSDERTRHHYINLEQIKKEYS